MIINYIKAKTLLKADQYSRKLAKIFFIFLPLRNTVKTEITASIGKRSVRKVCIPTVLKPFLYFVWLED